MSTFTKLTSAFILASLFFLTLALVLPAPKMTVSYNESVISKSPSMGVSKFRDNYYFHLASLIIPIVALFFWRIQRRISAFYGLGLLSVWLVALFWLILRAG